MSKSLIFGHKNPDTDTICSAIVFADLKTRLGENVEAVRLGAVNGETQFVLNHFGVEAPRQVETVSNEVETVMLVDHNERQQSAVDIDKVKVLEVIDHHRVANFETSDPLYFRVEPVGCTATILNKMYKENNLDIEPKIAGLMLSAIISDSLLFKSPTCTEQDIQAADELAEIAGVNAAEYGLDMLKAGADVASKTVSELLSMDAKEFAMGNARVEVAQINAVGVEDVLVRKPEIEATLAEVVKAKELDLFLFVITDILTNNSIAIASGAASEAVEKAFNVSLQANQAVLEGVVSRKKQIVPPLTEALSK